MGKAKDIILRVIPSNVANEFVKKYHYSGKVVPNSKLHFGAFLDKHLHGVMSYGSPMSKEKVIGLVSDTKWNEMLELNRMAFDEYLPRNSESRCLAISFKLIKKNAPHIKWILSFSDGCQSGDGTIYRAAGFNLTGIKPNKSTIIMPDGETIAFMTIAAHLQGLSADSPVVKLAKKYGIKINGAASAKGFLNAGGKFIPGFQLRYIKILNPNCKLTVPEIPYERIDELGAGMFRGERIKVSERKPLSEYSVDSSTPVIQTGGGGAEPTYSLQLPEGNNGNNAD